MSNKVLSCIYICLLCAGTAWAQQNTAVVVSSSTTLAPVQGVNQPATRANEEVRYTLGPDDVINVNVQRHPEFSGDFPINLEGKIQFRYVGDIDVQGFTKKEVEDKIAKIISRYVSSPEVTVTILDFRSKFYYVIGEVGAPGKIYMRSETTTVRDAIFAAGLPTIAAAMRKCVLITPDKKKPRKKAVDIYAILYGGNLKKNLEMRSGDTLYVPSTVMAKVFRTIAPITAPVTNAAEAQTGVNTLGSRTTATTTTQTR